MCHRRLWLPPKLSFTYETVRPTRLPGPVEATCGSINHLDSRRNPCLVHTVFDDDCASGSVLLSPLRSPHLLRAPPPLAPSLPSPRPALLLPLVYSPLFPPLWPNPVCCLLPLSLGDPHHTPSPGPSLTVHSPSLTPGQSWPQTPWPPWLLVPYKCC